MTYLEPQHRDRAPERTAFQPSQERRGQALWYEIMLYRFLCLLYAKGMLSPARFRRALPVPMRPAIYFYGPVQVSGCRHLRAAVQKQGGKILGDFELHEEEGPAVKTVRRFTARGSAAPGNSLPAPLSKLNYICGPGFYIAARMAATRGSPLRVTGAFRKFYPFLTVQKRDMSVQPAGARRIVDHLRVIMGFVDKFEFIGRACIYAIKFGDIAVLAYDHKCKPVLAGFYPHLFKKAHTPISLAVGGITKKPARRILRPNLPGHPVLALPASGEGVGFDLDICAAAEHWQAKNERGKRSLHVGALASGDVKRHIYNIYPGVTNSHLRTGVDIISYFMHS